MFLALSDIHANLPALQAVLADAPNVEAVYCCGDVVGYYPWPDAVIDMLREHDAVCVRGNHDEAVITESTFGIGGDAGTAIRWTIETLSEQHRSYLSGLPYTWRGTIDAADVFMVHGSPRAPIEEYVYPQMLDETFLKTQGVAPDILLVGHTHHQFSRTVGDTVVCNPGSVGQPRDGDPRAAYALIDPERRSVDLRRVAYDTASVADAVKEHGLPERLAQRLTDGW